MSAEEEFLDYEENEEEQDTSKKASSKKWVSIINNTALKS